MTLTAERITNPRVLRRIKLIALIRRATEELAELEHAEARVRLLADDVRPQIPPAIDAPPSRASSKIIRAWCRANDVPVPPFGQVPADVRRVYDEAHT